MKRYGVVVPIVASCYIEVEAENKEKAVEAALASKDVSLENVDEWDVYEQIVEGNVMHASINRAEVVSEDEIEESENNYGRN